MSSNTVGSEQRQITKSGHLSVGEPLSRADVFDYLLQEPEIKGKRYGMVKIISSKVRVRINGYKKVKYAYVECRKCKGKKWVMLENIVRGISKGCRNCMQPKRFPKWLLNRVIAQKQRCTNKKQPTYKDYGARGIQFKFESISHACQYILDQFGEFDKTLEIDRKDNNGHYEPGNLRLSTRTQNCSNTRKHNVIAKIHKFKINHPDVRYADGTLRKFFQAKMSFKEVIANWKKTRQRCGNRLSGISSGVDPYIASLYKGV